MGNAGTAMRLFTGLLSAQNFDSQLIGDASLMKRPMERVAKPLRDMGADVRTHNGTPPVDIGGGRRLRGIDYRNADRQRPSEIGDPAGRPVCRRAHAPSSRRRVSRDHSERMLESCGVKLISEGLAHHPASAAAARPANRSTVPGDFSSAAFFIVAGLLAAPEEGLLIQNVGLNPTRTGLLDILRRMGGHIEILNPRESGAEPVGGLAGAASALRGIDVPKDLVSAGHR